MSSLEIIKKNKFLYAKLISILKRYYIQRDLPYDPDNFDEEIELAIETDNLPFSIKTIKFAD